MKSKRKQRTVSVNAASKHIEKGKGTMTVKDVLECYIKTGEPIPEYYKNRDPEEIIANLKKL